MFTINSLFFIVLLVACLVLIKYYNSMPMVYFEKFGDQIETDHEENRNLHEFSVFNRKLVEDNDISLIPIKSRLAAV